VLHEPADHGATGEDAEDEEGGDQGNYPKDVQVLNASVLDLGCEGEDDESEDVVDDSGADDGFSRLSVEFAEFFEDVCGDRDAGGGERGSDEERGDEVVA